MELIISTPEDLKEIIKVALHEFELKSIKQPTTIYEKSSRTYTLPEAAKFCHMPLPTFRAKLSKRVVSGSKLGKRWVFQQSDLDKFLQKFHRSTSDEIQESVDLALRSQRRKEKKELAIKGGQGDD